MVSDISRRTSRSWSKRS